MKIIPIGDERGLLRPQDCITVVAFMKCADDGDCRTRMVEAVNQRLNTLEVRADGDIPELRAVIMELLVAPTSLKDVVAEANNRSRLSPVVTGKMLLDILSFAEHEPEMDFGYRKAKHLMVQQLSEVSDDEGRSTLDHDRYVAEAWSKFKSVAHLWAAYWLACQNDPCDPLPYTPETLPRFLSLAMTIRERATTTTIRRARDPILAPDTSWSIPPPISLPPGQLVLARPIEWMLDTARTYRA